MIKCIKLDAIINNYMQMMAEKRKGFSGFLMYSPPAALMGVRVCVRVCVCVCVCVCVAGFVLMWRC